MKYLIFFLLFILNQGIEFKLELQSFQMRCVSEILNEQTLVSGSCISLYHNYLVRIFDSNMDIIFTKQEQPEVFFSFTTFHSGTVQICIDSLDPTETIDIDFKLNTGIDAKDWTLLAQKNHLEPVELQIKQQNDLVMNIHKEQDFIANRESNLQLKYEQIYNQMTFLSIITISVLFAVSFMESIYLKRFFRYKKLI